ncbi:MAG: hypothetical protein C5B59_17300 [Bacteroidetes bacterium]|nr:MAG: hypothetical protein C5B59_17300 [Bacteroidota bacterium]
MSYKGIRAPIYIGQDGWSANKNQTQIKSSQLIVANDITYEYGTVGKEGGAVRYTPNPIDNGATILGGTDWWPNTNLQRMVVMTSSGKLLRDTGSGQFLVTLKSGLNQPTYIPYFVTGGSETQAANKKLFCFTGSNPVQVLSGDGTTTTNLATPPSDWATRPPIAGDIYVQRLWGASGHFVYFSNPANHEDFTTVNVTGQLAVYPGIGDEIVAIKAFKGFLFVWKKPFGIFFINANDPNIQNWSVTPVTAGLGAAGPGAVCAYDNDIVFLDVAGSVCQLASTLQFVPGTNAVVPTTTFASSSISLVAYIDPFIRDNFDTSALRLCQSGWHAHKREMTFCVTTIGSPVNNGRLTVDFNRPDIVRFRWSIRDICTAMIMARDTDLTMHPFLGDDKGLIWKIDQPTRSKDGQGYISIFQTGHEEFSNLFGGFPSQEKFASSRKLFQFLEVVANPVGNWNLSIDVYIDSKYTQTVQFNMGVSGAALDSFILDTSRLAGNAVQSKRRRIKGSGRRISLAGHTSGPGEDFSIEKIYVEFQPGAERDPS